MATIWKTVPSYPGMLASSEGEILLPPRHAALANGGYRIYTPKPVRGVVTRAGSDASHTYRGVYSREFGNIKVHRAVCEAFHGKAPTPAHVVMHLDEDAHNNRPENLAWGTQKENQNAPGFKAWASAVAREKFAGHSGMRKHANG